MELNITKLVNDSGCMTQFANSIANSGLSNIGEITWNNAVMADEYHLLREPEEYAEAIDFFEGFGCWDREELEGQTDAETNGLLLQFLAGDIQEMEAYETYEEYEKAAEAGYVSGRIYRSGYEWYAYIGE
jgi:hypothetical protein